MRSLATTNDINTVWRRVAVDPEPTIWSNVLDQHLVVPVVVLLLLLGGVVILCIAWAIWQQNRTLEQILAWAQQEFGTLLAESPSQEGKRSARVRSLITSLAGALQRAQTDLAEHSRYLQMLYDVNEQFNQQLSLNSVVRVIVESIWRIPQVDFVAVLLGEDELGPFHYAGVRGVPDPLSVLDQVCEVPLWGVLAQALVHHDDSEPGYLTIADIAAEGRPSPGEFPWQSEQGCLMIIPLRHADKTMGAILIGSTTPHALAHPTLVRYLVALAGSAARALKETQTRQQSNRWIRQLVSLQVLTRTITRVQDLTAILDALNTELSDMYGDVTVRIFLQKTDEVGEAGNEAVDSEGMGATRSLYTAHPIDPEERQLLWSSPVMRLVRWVMAAEQPLFFDPKEGLPEPSELYYRTSGRGLLVPIGEENALGAILVSAPDRPTPFEESDMIVVRTIANSAAIAIGNIWLYHKLLQAQTEDRAALAELVNASAGRYSGVT